LYVSQRSPDEKLNIFRLCWTAQYKNEQDLPRNYYHELFVILHFPIQIYTSEIHEAFHSHSFY